MTFDAGGDAAGVPAILDTLARERVPATFFLTGRWVQAYPSAAKRICAAHRYGNHSLTHPYFTKLDSAQIRSEVTQGAAAIAAVCGARPGPYFRFPFGDRNARTITAVNDLGYVTVSWTVDTLGWQGTSGGRSVASVTARVLAGAQPGEIVLMHVGANPKDHTTLDAAALPGIIAGLRERGYGFVTLNAFFTG